MAKFKIGDKVVRIGNGARTKNGQIYTVDGFHCCPKCGSNFISLAEIPQSTFLRCSLNGVPCDHVFGVIRIMALEANFEKLISLADCIEYKLKVSIPELTEIKIEQLQ